MFERNDDMLDKEERSMFESNGAYASDADIMRKQVAKTFLWMAAGVGVTALVSWFLYNSIDFWFLLYTKPMTPIVLLVAQLGIAVVFSARLFKMKVMTTRILFLVYAALLGVTCSSLAMIYTGESIAIAFGLSVAYFGALGVIGYTTKMNLMKIGPILYIGLLIMVLIEVVMMFMGQDTYTMLFAGIGLALFTGITAYDTQKMRKLSEQCMGDADMMNRISIYSAFQLYLDFINIFLYILRIIGNRD